MEIQEFLDKTKGWKHFSVAVDQQGLPEVFIDGFTLTDLLGYMDLIKFNMLYDKFSKASQAVFHDEVN